MVTKDNKESCYSQQAWSNNIKWEYIIIFTVTFVNNTVVIYVVLLLPSTLLNGIKQTYY